MSGAACMLDFIQALAVALGLLALGEHLRKWLPWRWLRSMASPVVGGLTFACVLALLKVRWAPIISFDRTLIQLLALIFYTTLGFSAKVRLLLQCTSLVDPHKNQRNHVQ